MSNYPERIWMDPHDGIACGYSTNPPEDDEIEYIRADLAAQREAELVAEAERLRGLVKKAFSEGFWNGVATHRGPDSDELGKIKEDRWRSSRAREALNTEDKG